MTAGKETYSLIRSSGGFAGEYVDVIESEFAAANGTAYVPPEGDEFSYRRINVLRTIQILSQCPVVIETFQTSGAFLRLPHSSSTVSLDDAGNGRHFVIKNSGVGNLTIQDSLGVNQRIITPLTMLYVEGNNSNNWDFLDGNAIAFDNSTNGFTSTRVQPAIEEAKTVAGLSSRGPTVCGFDGTGSSGRWLEFYQNCPSNNNPFIIAEPAQLEGLSLVTSSATATGTVRVFKNGVALQDLSLTAQKKNRVKGLSWNLTDLDELSCEVISGSITRPILYLFIRTL